MGKKQHQKDRNFLTAKEWKEEWGGFKKKTSVAIEHLPFYCCALSFTNFQDPVATADGTVYDVSNIVPYINRFRTSPVTGTPMELGDLIPLKFHKNACDQYECPILKKVFNQFSHIVAIKTSGNVFSFEAVQQFNIKLKSWHDLITDESFTKNDIIHIQQPHNIKSTAHFDHVKRELRVEMEDTNVIRNSNATLEKVLVQKGSNSGTAIPSSRRELALAQLEQSLRQKRLAKAKTADHHISQGERLCSHQRADMIAEDHAPDWRLQGPDTKPTPPSFKPGTSTWDTDTFSEARKIKKVRRAAMQEGAVGDQITTRPGPQARQLNPADWWAMHYKLRYEESVQTIGHAARSFTSTTAAVTTKNEYVRTLKSRCPSDRGYLTLKTSRGPLNIELACELVPRTCENFLVLCEMGYYTGTIFHRSIRNFMVQGGDPTGTGKGGDSIYGATFADEFDNRLLHSRRGVLAMANHGKDTNASQFYILYKSAHHLDYNHTVFGAVVGGLETLSSMENVPTDDEDRACERICITGCVIHKNPFRDMMKAEEGEDASRSSPVRLSEMSHQDRKELPDPRHREGDMRSMLASTTSGNGGRKRKLSNEDLVKEAHTCADLNEFDAW
eukprot:jgi/Ulvmu1/12218/UM086_0008.1